VIAVANGARNWVWPTLAAFAVVGPSLAYVATESSRALVRPLTTSLFLSLLVGIGEFFRSRRERYREISKQVAARQQTAAEAERVRIARELHDVLAHSLSQISVQAGVGLHLFDTQPERARESLAAIKETSGQALEEVRGVLGFLRSPDEPAARAPEPDLSRLPSLIRSFELSGLPVTLTNNLAPDIPAATQLALFRIVQESLTNAARHAGAAEVTVRLESEGDEYVAIISDNGHATGSTAQPGRGIVGMRERAELLGGSLSAAPTEGGGFRVEARLPAHHNASTNGAPS
jgi:signal transduction histidine kinase